MDKETLKVKAPHGKGTYAHRLHSKHTDALHSTNVLAWVWLALQADYSASYVAHISIYLCPFDCI